METDRLAPDCGMMPTDTPSTFDRYALDKRMPESVPPFFAQHVRVSRGGRILDIGCGDGRFLRFCQQVAPEAACVGTDISWVRAVRTSKGGLDVLQSDGEMLPVRSRSFDLALLVEVIEHVRNPERVLAEVTRVLKPDGRLVLTTPNYPAKRVYDWLAYIQGKRSSPADDPTHFSPFGARRIVRLCRRYFSTVTYQIVHIAGEGRWPVLARLRLSPTLGPVLGHKIIILARSPIPAEFRPDGRRPSPDDRARL
jgi:ubiquinone/menaquinone biosynthesis C-methylase UbiE